MGATGLCSTPRPICASKSPRRPALAPRRRRRRARQPDQGGRGDQWRRRPCRRAAESARGAAVHASTARAACSTCSAANKIFNVLAPAYVARERIAARALRWRFAGAGVDLGLSVEAFPVAGKIALWLEDAFAANYGSAEGDTLGLKIIETASGNAFFYIPGCARRRRGAGRAARGRATLVLFDGTLWHENEMIDQGLIGKTGTRMGHINMSGAGRFDRRLREARGRAQDFRAHQQFESGAERILARARGSGGRGLGDRRGRHGDRAMNDVSESHADLDAPRLSPADVRSRDPRGRRRALSRQASVP